MLYLYAEQLNALYKVMGLPLITFPLTEEQEYLMAQELQRTVAGLRPTEPGFGEMNQFYQCVYEEFLSTIMKS